MSAFETYVMMALALQAGLLWWASKRIVALEERVATLEDGEKADA